MVQDVAMYRPGRTDGARMIKQKSQILAAWFLVWDLGMTALACDLPCEVRQVIVGGSSACLFGCAEFRGRRILRHHHLYDE